MTGKELLDNRYQLMERIGSGGMAVVYKALDTALDRTVAIKLLRDEYSDDPDFIRQFQKEARAVAKVSHQNLVNIYDFGQSDNKMYLVMEYVEGCTLKELISKCGSLPVSQILDYSIQICAGMNQAHAQQIIHKDIKPHNIMIDANHVVKVTDFGIAQAMNNLTMTHSKGILGSAHYFSPEQARGEMVDNRTDIYSLGVVMYEMCLGKVPFTGDNPVTVAMKHMQDPMPSITEQRPDIPEELENIIRKAMEKRPSQRYGSMEELGEALTALQSELLQKGYFQKEDLSALAEMEYHSEKYHPVPVDGASEHYTKLIDGKNELRQQAELDDTRPIAIHRRFNWKLGFAAAILSILLFMGIFSGTRLFMGKDNVVVPDVGNMTVLEAEKVMADKGLVLTVLEQNYDADIEAGHIISQTPKAENHVKSGHEIGVVVSIGPETFIVPDLKGKTEQEARVALENASLKLGEVVHQIDTVVPLGQVLYQSVPAGEAIRKGLAVSVVISDGNGLLQMPGVTGMTEDEAKQLLKGMGLTHINVQPEASEAKEGTVFFQKPVAGTEVNPEDTVTLAVSKGLEEKSSEFDIISPENGTVVATVTDAKGTRELYRQDVKAGDRVYQSVIYFGTGTLNISVNGNEIKTISLQ